MTRGVGTLVVVRRRRNRTQGHDRDVQGRGDQDGRGSASVEGFRSEHYRRRARWAKEVDLGRPRVGLRRAGVAEEREMVRGTMEERT